MNPSPPSIPTYNQNQPSFPTSSTANPRSFDPCPQPAMSNYEHPETNPYFRPQLGSPSPDQPHQPPFLEAQVSPPQPARPQGQRQPQFRPSRPPERVPTHHAPFPIHPSYQSGHSLPPRSSARQPPPQKGEPRRPQVQVLTTPQREPDAQSSPPPHDEQTRPLHTGTRVSSPPVEATREQTPHRAHGLLIPPPSKTKFHIWFLAIFCAILGVVIIVGGLIVLIVYLVFRPHLPKFDISSATLNAAYLDMDYLLNADLTLLTNFSNPNRKVRNDFSYVILDLYYGSNAIATQYIDPFSTGRLESRLANVQMISSQVRLPTRDSEKLKKQLEGNGLVVFEVKGFVRVRSKFGSFLRYSYWLYSYCSIALTAPPTGVLRASKCRTKR